MQRSDIYDSRDFPRQFRAELFAKGFARAKNVRLHLADRDIELSRDFLIAEAIEVIEDERHALGSGQGLERALDQIVAIRPCEVLFQVLRSGELDLLLRVLAAAAE